jgi:hypothetical protein
MASGMGTDGLPDILVPKLPTMIFAQIPVTWAGNKAEVKEESMLFSSNLDTDFKSIEEYTITLNEKLKSGGKSLRHSKRKRKRKNKSRNKR